MAALTDLELSARLGLLVLANVFLFLWTRYVVAPAKAGWPRVRRAVPLVPAMVFVTCLFRLDRPQEYLLALNGATIYMWLVPCKVWSLAMNRGQLVKSYDAGSTAAFALGLLGPVVVAFKERPVEKDKDHSPARSGRSYTDVEFEVIRFEGRAFYVEAIQIIARIVAKVGLVYGMRLGYYGFGESGHLFWRDVCLGWIMYAVSSFVEDIYVLSVLLTLNLKIATSFDCPFLAQSMQELWSRRYNLVAGECFRDLVFDPVVEDCWMRGRVYKCEGRPSPSRRGVAVFATFIVSGLFHCFMLKYIAPESAPYKIGLFFVASCFVVLAETVVRSFLKSSSYGGYVSRVVPAWMRILYTLSVLFYLAHILFWPEVHRAGLSDGLVDGLFPS